MQQQREHRYLQLELRPCWAHTRYQVNATGNNNTYTMLACFMLFRVWALGLKLRIADTANVPATALATAPSLGSAGAK